ncbi:MAG: hypothetical protein KGL01_06995 [Betaproteobacteria bacterium]|nr:hypothetical protein [Betaproteobacteria bacterium]
METKSHRIKPVAFLFRNLQKAQGETFIKPPQTGSNLMRQYAAHSLPCMGYTCAGNARFGLLWQRVHARFATPHSPTFPGD